MKKKKLEQRLRDKLRRMNKSLKTEKSYIAWYKRYVKFYDYQRHPADMGRPEVEAFLTHLATEGNVSASTQNQAFYALLFLYEHVLEKPLEGVKAVRATKRKKLPVHLSHDEARRLLTAIADSVHRLMCELMYGAGLRVSEVLRLRVGDVDFENRQIRIIDSKGGVSRCTLLPDSLTERLKTHLGTVKQLHADDLARGNGAVYLPSALAKKDPSAPRKWVWQYVFPSPHLSTDPRSGEVRRHHRTAEGIRTAVRQAAKTAGLESKRVTPHTLRHSFATQLYRNGYRLEKIQELMGHKDPETTKIYVHLVEGTEGIRSPLDDL